jgi:hypothetical protein
LRTISAPERRKHASVYNYWLTIKGSREFPPIHDLDPLEISDAGPHSLLVEMIGGGEDAEIRHVGNAIGGRLKLDRISEAPNPSLLSCIAARLPVVAACREAFAFEDSFETADGKRRCWVTLLPFSATGAWIDFVYGFVTLDSESTAEIGEEPTETFEEAVAEAAIEPVEQVAEAKPFEVEEPLDLGAVDEPPPAAELEDAGDFAEPEALEPAAEPEPIPDSAEVAEAPVIKPSFSQKFFEKLETVKGFYGSPVEVELDPDTVEFESGEVAAPQDLSDAGEPEAEEESVEPQAAGEPETEIEPEPVVEPEPVIEPEPLAEFEQPEAADPPPAATSTLEGTLESKLTDVRAKADEARQAKLRANAALYEGLSAAYDFALDAEDNPEEYLKLVQAEGLKIQLRSPMRPVAKLAFDGMCDEATIKQLEAILAWAFEEELPRGTLAEQIEAAGGIAPILSGQAKAA